MSFDTSNIPCSTQISVHNSDKTGCISGNSNGIVETLTADSQLLKIFILSNKEYRLNICAILQDVNANFCIDKIEEFMNTIDYDCVKSRQNAMSENLKFDVLIYGYSKRGNSAIDFELLVDEQYSESEESRQAVCTVSKQLMETINTVIKSSAETNLMFCIECGIRMWNETDCRQHAKDQHKWTLNDDEWGQAGSNAVVLQAHYENDNECIVNRFTHIDWLGAAQLPVSIPFIVPNFDHMAYRRDVDQSQSSPSLSILPSWTTATSPCTIMCPNCDSVFTSTVELEEHTRLNHQGTNTPINRCTNRPVAATSREYRCHICNYKTVTKGNLHIHFQSEKHRNNQREHDQNEHKGHMHNQDPSPTLGSLPQLHILDSLISRAQNDFFSNIKANSFPSSWPAIHSNDQTKESSTIGLPIEAGLTNMAIFKCEICQSYSHSDIEIILDHAERPRPLPSNSEVSKVVRASMDGASGAELEHVCMLDGYKTRIKANFLLHFKTEKHQQKLQLLAHAGEGGIENANKIMLQMVTEQTSLISIHCSLCRATFSTAHKLRLHVDSSDHQINQKIANSFHIWKKSLETNNNFKDEKVITGFECKPCGSVFRRYIEVLDHFHVQKNSIHMAVFKQEMDINSLVKVHYYNKSDKSDLFNCSNVDKLATEKSDIAVPPLFRCNLCNDPVDRKELRNHLKEIHKIQDHCVQQLINLAEKAHMETITKLLPLFKSLKISDKPKDWCDCVLIKETDNLEPMVRCQQCGKCFATVSLLEEHRTAVKHNDIFDHRGHLCYKKGCNQYFKSISLMIDHFYEIHAFQIPEYKRLESFKYVCKVCHILAFNCTVKCYQHMNSHSLFGEFDCVFCGLATEGRNCLRSHIENYHVIYDDNSDSKKTPDSSDIAKSATEPMTTTSLMVAKNECQSTFSSPESIVNKENRNQAGNKTQEHIATLRNTVPLGTDLITPRLNSLNSISTLISTVGLENVKLVIETMINSKCDQNENDSTVWKYAESIIDVANIKETLIEKCRECGKMFSSQSVLKKHDRICNNPSSEILHEFERIVSVCRDHLTRMMLTYSNDTTRKPLFVAINSHSNDTFREDTVPLQAQPLRPNISCDDSLPHFSTKFSSAGLLNINRSMIQPMMNPYRFHPNNHNFLNILPPLGMFPMPQFRFRNLNSPNGPTNLTFFNSKPPVNNQSVNSNIIDHQKFSDPTQKIDNSNRKRTQIKNHQYDILRSYFNINNPPNDETITEIINKTGLDKKTVKHWFRNTLFKERQRCKDSPYNFNIPPETSLNIEEYEKTGKIEVRSECSRTSSPIDKTKNSDDTKTDASSDDYKIEAVKRGPGENTSEPPAAKFRRISDNDEESAEIAKSTPPINIGDNFDRFSLIHKFEKLEEKPIININTILKDKSSIVNKKESTVISISPHNEDVPLDLSYQSSGFSLLNGSRNSFTFDPISPFESEQEPIENCSSNCGERRHRTTLTAMQIQAMKSIFIHCRSPSHNELGILGNVLSLDMRVVQVWFQNQRAKLKKQERDMFYREKPVFPEATPSIIELPKCDRIHCLVCNQNLNPSISKQAHLFSNDHLIILMRYLVTKSNDMKLNWKSESNSL